MKDYHVGFPGMNNLWYRQRLMSKYAIELKMDPADLALWYAGGKYGHFSLNEIVLNMFGINVNQREEIRMSDWSGQNLSDEQIIFACIDTHYAYLIGREFKAWQWGL
jgi:hypothetical protein